MKLGTAKIRKRSYAQGARAEAAQATGERIVEAFLARMMTQWFDEITLDRVAEDAGVTVQTVVRRFGGKEGLLAEAVKILATQINARRAAPSRDIDRLIHHLVNDYEQTGDPVIRMLALEPRHPALKAYMDYGRSEHRRWASAAFAGAIGPLEAAKRERAIDMLVTATDVYVWKLLRRDMGRNIAATEATIKTLLMGVLAEISGTLK